MKHSILFLLIFVMSCQSIERAPKPEVLIPEEKMVDIFVDLSLLDAAGRLNFGDVKINDFNAQEFIYDKYAIDSATLASNNIYYSENLKIYQPVFDSVKARLEVMKTEFDTLKKIEQRKQDSIRELEKENDSIELKVDEKKKKTIKKLIPRTNLQLAKKDSLVKK